MKRMRLSVKLVGGFLIVTVIVLGVGLAGWNGISTSLTTSEKMIYTEGIAKQLLQREIDHLNWARKVGEFQRNEDMTELGVEKDEHKCGFGKWYYGEERRKAEAEMPELRSHLTRIEEPHRALHNSAKELEKLLKKGKEFRKEAVSYYGTETSKSLKEVQNILEEILPQVAKHSEESQRTASAQGSNIKKIVLVGMIVGTLVALTLGIFLSFSITKPINRVVEGLTGTAEQVASASSQVSSASQSLAEGASEQAAGLEETSSSIEEMSSMTRKNADNAQQANVMMADTNRVVEEANHSMKELNQSMGEITVASEETGKIIKTIDEIAFQTNLLALNAAVEAARAGEAGAGFAVVADEVRNLAMRAAEAAKNTSSLIDGTVKKIKSGSDIVVRTNEAFTKVAAGSKKVADLVAEITAASQEQAQGVDQINKAVAEMDKVTQQNAANAEESAAASEEMNAQAEQMKGFVADLSAVVGGSGNGNGVMAEKGLSLHDGKGGKIPVVGHTLKNGIRKFLPSAARRDTAHVGEAPRARPEQVIPLEGKDFKEF